MYNVVKTVITVGGYKLTEIQHKIKKLYVMGDLTEAEMDELMTLASGNVSADAERPEMLAMIQGLEKRIAELENRVGALELGEDSGDSGSGDEGSGESGEVVYPEWTAWDGISSNYQKGAIVQHNGVLYESVFEGQNVWEPGTAGTDSMWIVFEG